MRMSGCPTCRLGWCKDHSDGPPPELQQVWSVIIEYSGNPPDDAQVYLFHDEAVAEAFGAALCAANERAVEENRAELIRVDVGRQNILLEAPRVSDQ